MLFAFAEVKHQPAVDVRSENLKDLVTSRIISHTAATTIAHGRRWHHETNSKGAVGLVHANRMALKDDITQPLLLLEEDCVFTDAEKLVEQVELLLTQLDTFDMAVFGIFNHNQKSKTYVDFSSDWFHITDMFWGLHCVLYSPSGRATLANYLENWQMDMQLDSLYGRSQKFFSGLDNFFLLSSYKTDGWIRSGCA